MCNLFLQLYFTSPSISLNLTCFLVIRTSGMLEVNLLKGLIVGSSYSFLVKHGKESLFYVDENISSLSSVLIGFSSFA